MNLRRHDLNLIPILHALLRHQNVTKAGAEVGLSQSATSHALMRLRELFGDPLLVASGRDMLLSRKAETMLDLLQVSVSTLEQLFEARPFEPSQSERHFRIATSDYVSVMFLPKLLRRLREEAPGVTAEVLWDVSDATAKLRGGHLDMIILPRGSITADGVVAGTIYEDSLVVVTCAEGDGPPRSLTLAEFSASRLIVFRRQTSLIRGFAEQQLLANNIALEDALFVPDFLMIPMIVAESDYVALLHKRFATKMQSFLPLALTPPPFPVGEFHLDGYWATNSDRDPGHRWFRDLLTRCILGEEEAGKPEVKSQLRLAAASLKS